MAAGERRSQNRLFRSATFELVPAIALAFRKQYPRVSLKLKNLPTVQQLEALRAGTIDAGFVRMPIIARDLSVDLVHREPFALVLSRSHPLARKEDLSVKDVAHEPFIAYGRKWAPDYYDNWTDICRHAGFIPTVIQETAEMATALALVAAGLGVAILPQGNHHPNRGVLKVKVLNREKLYSEIGIAIPHANRTPLLRHLLATAKALSNGNPSRLFVFLITEIQTYVHRYISPACPISEGDLDMKVLEQSGPVSRRMFVGAAALAGAGFFALGAGAQTRTEQLAGRQGSSKRSRPGEQVSAGENPDSNLRRLPTMAIPGRSGSPSTWPKRMQGGGWTHQVTQRELPPSKDLAGVNMRLTAGSFRELHWHTANEWAIMLTGKARVSVMQPDGKMFIDDVEAGDLWYFPAGFPAFHSGFGRATAASSCWCSTRAFL